MGSRYEFGSNAEGTPREAPGHAASRRKHEAASRAPIAGPKPNPNTTTIEDRALKGRMLEYRAHLWIDENPDAWAFVVSRALAEAKAGRRFGIKQLVEEARRKDFADACGGRTRICNSLTPAFARILIAEHPEVRRFIDTKRSVLDEVRV